MKLTFLKDDKEYTVTYYDSGKVWLRATEGDGMEFSPENLTEFHETIFNSIDEFFNKYM
jgi:hypothetical protein